MAISHILYADDTLPMCEARKEQFLYIRGISLCFEAVTTYRLACIKAVYSILMQTIMFKNWLTIWDAK